MTDSRSGVDAELGATPATQFPGYQKRKVTVKPRNPSERASRRPSAPAAAAASAAAAVTELENSDMALADEIAVAAPEDVDLDVEVSEEPTGVEETEEVEVPTDFDDSEVANAELEADLDQLEADLEPEAEQGEVADLNQPEFDATDVEASDEVSADLMPGEAEEIENFDAAAAPYQVDGEPDMVDSAMETTNITPAHRFVEPSMDTTQINLAPRPMSLDGGPETTHVGMPVMPRVEPAAFPARAAADPFAPTEVAPRVARMPASPAPHSPVSGADPAIAGGTLPARALGSAPKVRRTRRARLRISRVDPWSVMKTSLLFGIAGGIMFVIASYVVVSVIEVTGVFEPLNEIINQVISSPSSPTLFDITDYINSRRATGLAALIGAVDVVIFTALVTVFSFLYNLSATMLGGIEVTLAED